MAVSAFFKRQKQNTIDFWKRLGQDYLEVATGTARELRNKPWKGAMAGGIAGGLGYAYSTNPTEQRMLDELRERRQTMALIPSSCHSRKTDEELATWTHLLNQRRLEHYNFLFFSILVKHNQDVDVRLYSSQDASVNGWWIKNLLSNVYDFGAFNRWFLLEKKFVDHDVNESELFPDEVPRSS